MISENKTTKYLIYAIGEIILVVIGILIALQINEWDQHKKTEKEIESSLRVLRTDLVRDSILISENLPEVLHQFRLNESLRKRIAKPDATIDTLIKITRHEFNPNWTNTLLYNTNAYNSLIETGLLEGIPESLKNSIKNYYNQKFYLNTTVEKITDDYRVKLREYVDTYTFGSTPLHDQGHLIDSLVWNDINPSHLAAAFQGLSNFKRILFTLTKDEMEYSLENARDLIEKINKQLEE